MRITPIDIETRRFSMKFRGFHTEEVSSFLEQIREELEDLLRENAALKERIHQADTETHRFWEIQDLLSRTLQDAHQISEEYKIHARREADSLLENAEETARDMKREAHEKALQLSEEIVDLKMNRKEFARGIRNIMSRFESVIEGGTGVQQRNSTEAGAADALLMSETEIRVIEGHQREEAGSQTEQQ